MKPEEKLHRRVVAELRRAYHRRGYAPGTEPFFHCANESMVPVRYRAKLAALGLSRGVPDLIVVQPVTWHGETYAGAAIELKSICGALSDEQERWLTVWSAAGFCALTLRPHTTGPMLAALGLIDDDQVLLFTD